MDLIQQGEMFFVSALLLFSNANCTKSAVFRVFNSSTHNVDFLMQCCKSVVKDGTVLGARLNTKNKTCEAVKLDWIGETIFEKGYEYCLKRLITDNQDGTEQYITLPGRFLTGTKLSLNMFLPNDLSILTINIVDDFQPRDTLEYVDEKILLHMKRYSSSIAFNQYKLPNWLIEDKVYTPMVLGQTISVEFTSYHDGINVTLDGSFVYKSYRAGDFPPDSAKCLHVRSDVHVLIREILYNGVPA